MLLVEPDWRAIVFKDGGWGKGKADWTIFKPQTALISLFDKAAQLDCTGASPAFDVGLSRFRANEITSSVQPFDARQAILVHRIQQLRRLANYLAYGESFHTLYGFDQRK
jgi:hypothetical protein